MAADLNELTASGRLEVIAGGPGTGKTTRVARLVAELIERAAADGTPAAADRAGRSHRQSGRPPAGGRQRGDGPSARGRRRSIGCSAGDRVATAVSRTTAPTASLTTW